MWETPDTCFDTKYIIEDAAGGIINTLIQLVVGSGMLVRPLLFTSTALASRTFPLAAAMSTSSTTSGNQQCGGKSAVVFLHGLGDSPAGWSSLEHQLPSLKPSLGQDVHYVFPPAPTIPITINGGELKIKWFVSNIIHQWLSFNRRFGFVY